jgi:hypothetical protein
MVESIEEGLAERKFDKDKLAEDEKEEAAEIDRLKAKTLAELEEDDDDDEVMKNKKAAAKAAALKLNEEDNKEKAKRPVIRPKGPVKKPLGLKKPIK